MKLRKLTRRSKIFNFIILASICTLFIPYEVSVSVYDYDIVFDNTLQNSIEKEKFNHFYFYEVIRTIVTLPKNSIRFNDRYKYNYYYDWNESKHLLLIIAYLIIIIVQTLPFRDIGQRFISFNKQIGKKIMSYIFEGNTLRLKRNFIAYYLLWFLFHFILLVWNWQGYDEEFYPFGTTDLNSYDFSEFTLYIIFPITIIYVIRLLTSNLKEKPKVSYSD